MIGQPMEWPLSITTVLLRGSIASSLSINVRGSIVRPLL